MSLAGLGAVGCGTDGSTVVKVIDMGAALPWLLRGKGGPGWCVLLLVYPLTQWLEQPPVQAVRGCRLSVMKALRRISSSTLPALPRRSHLESWTFLLCPRIFQLVLAFGCWMWVQRLGFFGRFCVLATWLDSGYMFFERLWTNFSHFLRCGELES